MKRLAVLNKYFNTNGDPDGYQRKKASEFQEELKAMTDAEKDELAILAAEDMGIELTS